MCIDELKKAIENRSVVVVVGSGVSIAASNNNSVSSWNGLLESGVQRIQEELKNEMDINLLCKNYYNALNDVNTNN